MEWLEKMNAVVDYLEANLTEDIDPGRVADIACCSTYHLQRVFLAVYGVSITEYVRRRRLTLAAGDLQTGTYRVIDLAVKYGYTSADAFSRAFRNLHGVTPQAAREPGVKLVAFPRLRFHIMLTGGEDMDYRIVEKPEFEVLVKSITLDSEIYANYTIDAGVWEGFWWDIWEKFYSGDGETEIEKLTGGVPGRVTGAAWLAVTTVDKDTGRFSYALGVEGAGQEIPNGYQKVSVPASIWAVFTSRGAVPKTIHDLEDRIFREWFPSLGYEHDSAPEIEVYLPGDRQSDEYRSEVWMPVVIREVN